MLDRGREGQSRTHCPCSPEPPFGEPSEVPLPIRCAPDDRGLHAAIRDAVSETDRALEALRRDRAPIDSSIDTSGGVYAWFAREAMSIGPIEVSTSDPIYVGRATNLAIREYAHHLSPQSTGWSTLRRSIGALLKTELQLVAIPRGSGGSDSDFTHYRFEVDGERRLTDWMLEHLELGMCPVDDPTQVEAGLPGLLAPPLNLKDCRNPEAQQVRALRKACADEARKRSGCA